MTLVLFTVVFSAILLLFCYFQTCHVKKILLTKYQRVTPVFSTWSYHCQICIGWCRDDVFL